ncbi:MAG: DUF3604 domain-containing protein [Actinobacteria bacterium]|nr:DUF3604 domain-containing protein [Actinomycetota bacterium]
MPLSRRELLTRSSSAGALLLAPGITRRGGLLDLPLGTPTSEGAARDSDLLPGLKLVHADMHNHSLMSDGDGDPAGAFASMRGHGLDVAALTDHATVGKGLPRSLCAGDQDCQSLMGIDEASWARTGELAEQAYDEGSFVAMRGFEWSSPTLGHMNVWFSETWTDPLHTGGAGTGEGAGQFLHDEFRHDDVALPGELTAAINDAVSRHGANAGMRLFYEWLNADPGRPVLGGGADGLAGFNHPGREVGRFGYFTFDPALRDRVVSLEVFNRKEDYLFEGTDSGVESPIAACLNAGWRPGLLGVTDEHGTDWGGEVGKGRGGLWVTDLSRDGVREALAARRFFATNEAGIRLAVVGRSGDQEAAMGGALTHTTGRVVLEVDVAGPSDWAGRTLGLQVLGAGSPMPEILDHRSFTVGQGSAPLTVTVPADVDDTRYLIVRITDPDKPIDGRAAGEYRARGGAIAYASPLYLEAPAG